MRHRRPGTPSALLATGLPARCFALTALAGCAPPPEPMHIGHVVDLDWQEVGIG